MSNEDNGPRFEELIAWQKARALVKVVSELVDRPPIATRYAFKDQLHRAAVSVMSNIAEGYERGGRGEFHQMLSIAKGSCAEVRSLFYVAVDAGFISQPEFEALNARAREVGRIIGGLRASVGRAREADRLAARARP